MSTQVSSSRSGGVGVVGLLGVLFIGLKLTGYIDWSWWWVLSPFWLSAGLIIILVMVVTWLDLKNKYQGGVRR